MKVDGLIALESAHNYATTVAQLDAALAEHGITPLARVDHAAAASSVGLELSPVLLILFGNPKVGTKLMQEQPTAGIDLPLKLLVWVEGNATFVGYNDPEWFAERHDVRGAPEVLSGMRTLLQALAATAAGG
jgi:uncharacterized protein (DUF302 family)